MNTTVIQASQENFPGRTPDICIDDSIQQNDSYANHNTSKAELVQKRKDSHKLTLCFEDVPFWYQDNKYLRAGISLLNVFYFVPSVTIILGYRQLTFSHIVSLKSLFYLHNETFNIYTHLIGALIAFGLILY